MSDRLKTSYGVFEQDDFVEESGQLRELTVTITLSEYRELVASLVLQHNYIDQIDDLTEAMDWELRLCANINCAKNYNHGIKHDRNGRSAFLWWACAWYILR